MAANTVTLTMSDLVEETLELVSTAGERARPITLGSGTVSSVATTLNLTVADQGFVSVGEILEFDSELMYVSDIDDSTSPYTFTVKRGFFGSAEASHLGNITGTLNPRFPRYQVQKQIQRAFSRFTSKVPNLVSSQITADGDRLIELPATTMKVISVRYRNAATGQILPLSNWRFEERLASGISSTTKALQMGTILSAGTVLEVVSQQPWSWSTSPVTETSTISFVVGGEDLACYYAAGVLLLGHEASRLELTSMEEWSQEAAMRNGVNLRLVQQFWGQYYQRLDEVMATQDVPKRLAFRRRIA